MKRWPKTGKQTLTESSSLCVPIFLILHTDLSVVDWFVFRCCCYVDLRVNPGHSTEPAGYLQLLPCEHIPGYYCRPESTQYFHSFFPTPIYSSKLYHLGQRTLVLELYDQYHLCSTCYVATAVGSKVPQGHSTTSQSTQTSSYPFVLC